MRKPSRWLGAALGAVAASLGLAASLTLAAVPASANTIAMPSMGKANSVSYGDSDFEGTGTGSVGDWVNVANSTLSTTATAILHGHALKAVAGTTSAMQYKLGNAQQVNVTAGDTYRIGAYFKAPALSGRTVTWAFGFYNASNTFLGWTSGSALSLDSGGGWQWEASDITAPATATYMLGSPRVTENGQAAGEELDMDWVQQSPVRPAMVIGADGSANTTTAWNSANSSIGPLQEEKEFNSGVLPSTFSGTETCAGITKSVTCVIAYKNTVTQTQMNTFVASIPAGQAVVLVPHQEPENGDYTSGSLFISYFETQSNEIRSAAAGLPNVFVAMDSSGSGYASGAPGADCSYVVPSSYTDFYLLDHYQDHPNGSAFNAGQYSDHWSRWLDCISTGSPTTAGTAPKPIGMGEFGFGASGGAFTCTAGNESNRATTMSATGSYLQSLPATIGAPVDFMDYWWQDDSTSSAGCKDWNFPAASTTNTAWKGFETQNGGGAS